MAAEHTMPKATDEPADDVLGQNQTQELQDALAKAAVLTHKVGTKRLDNEFCLKHFGPEVVLLLRGAGLLPACSSSSGHALPADSNTPMAVVAAIRPKRSPHQHRDRCPDRRTRGRAVIHGRPVHASANRRNASSMRV